MCTHMYDHLQCSQKPYTTYGSLECDLDWLVWATRPPFRVLPCCTMYYNEKSYIYGRNFYDYDTASMVVVVFKISNNQLCGVNNHKTIIISKLFLMCSCI